MHVFKSTRIALELPHGVKMKMSTKGVISIKSKMCNIFCLLFGLMFYVQVNNFSVMSGRVFLG